MSELIWLGVSMITVGGVKERSSSIWMATRNTRQSVEQVRRIISAVRITSRIRKHINTKNSPLLCGMHQVIRPDGLYRAVTAFGLYRWHILDPVRFEKDLKVTIQDLGWRHDGRYNNQKSDISSTTFWYQVEPHAKFPALPSKDDLEIPRW